MIHQTITIRQPASIYTIREDFDEFIDYGRVVPLVIVEAFENLPVKMLTSRNS
jgi:hypothetical protein